MGYIPNSLEKLTRVLPNLFLDMHKQKFSLIVILQVIGAIDVITEALSGMYVFNTLSSSNLDDVFLLGLNAGNVFFGLVCSYAKMKETISG